MQRRFEGKVAIVTGATSGLGRHAAVAFAREGARVVAAGRRADAGAGTVARIEAAGGEGLFVATDVSKGDEVKRLVDAAIDRFGRLDLAYNVAGVSGAAFTKLAEYPEEAWDEVIAANLKGMFLCMKFEVQAMLDGGGGAIVNMSSVAGMGGTPGGVGYVASKHGVIGLTRAAALDHAEQGVRINVVAPGLIYTEMLEEGEKESPGLEEELRARHPIGRVGQMEEVTNAVLWLCSEQASFVVGATLVVDGGYTIA